MKFYTGIIVFLVATKINDACEIDGKVYKNGETWVRYLFCFYKCQKKRLQKLIVSNNNCISYFIYHNSIKTGGYISGNLISLRI